jgi:hypothetical protein
MEAKLAKLEDRVSSLGSIMGAPTIQGYAGKRLILNDNLDVLRLKHGDLDSRYYTEEEADARFAASGHAHDSSGTIPHKLLSTTHPDTAASSVVRGDLITGQGATPAWTRLAKGTAGYLLTCDANDVKWDSKSNLSIVSGTGTLNYLMKWTPDGNTAGNSRLFDSGTALGIGTIVPSSFVDIEQTGTAKVVTDLLELTNKYNAADMVGTGTGLLFRQWYYDAVTPAVADAGRIACVTSDDWTVGYGTSYLSFWPADGQVLKERFRMSVASTLWSMGAKTWDANELTAFGLTDYQGGTCSVGATSTGTGGLTLKGFRDSSTASSILYRAYAAQATSAAMHSFSCFLHNGAGALTIVSDANKLLDMQNNGLPRYVLYGNGAIEQHYDTISHGMTDYLPTTAYSSYGPRWAANPEYGGLLIIGASDAIGPGMTLMGIGQYSCSIHSYFDIIAGDANGTGIQDVSGSNYALRVVNNTTQLLGIYGDGDIVIGSGAAHDYSIRANGSVSDGIITFMDDENRIDFSNDVHVTNALGVGTSTPTTAGWIQCSEALGVGGAPTASVIGLFKKDYDGSTELYIENVNNHASARTRIDVQSDGSNTIGLMQYSTLKAMDRGGIAAGGVSCLTSSNTNGLLISNNSATPIWLSTQGYVRMTIAAGGNVAFTNVVSVKVFNQAAEPSTTDIPAGYCGFWTDTDDSKCYLCYNHGGTVKTVELA